MIKLEKTTKTNLKAKGLQVVDGNIVDVETGETVDIPTLAHNVFNNDIFDFTFTTSTKEESEVDTEVTEDDFDGREY